MKTKTILSVLGTAAFLFSAISLTAGNPVKNDGSVSLNPVVKHHVNVILSSERKTCNMYQVEILNGAGQMVAPPKQLLPGVSGYDFYERGPVSGVRIAVLVLSPAYSHFSCETEYHTAPALIKGTFLPGETYRYDLFPKTEAPRE